MKHLLEIILITSFYHLSIATVGLNTVILERTADDGAITAKLPSELIKEEVDSQNPCVFDGGRLVLSHPMSLKPSDKHFNICNLFQKGYELMVDNINSAPNCGVKVQGKNYGLTLRSYSEDSSAEKAAAIAAAAEPSTDFFLASYTSGLTEGVSKVANESNKIMIAPGSYFTSVYFDRPASFGVLPLPELYLLQVIPMLAGVGAKTIHTVYEGGPGKQCESIGPVAEANGMIVQGESSFEKGPTKEDFLPLAKNMSKSENDPDVVITCTYEASCKEWIYALREANWSPRAQVFSICIGLESFSEAVGTDAEYLIGMSPWDRSLSIKDSISGWSPEEFASLFEAYSGRDAAYHAALGQSSVSLVAQAVEFADSLETSAVAEALSTQVFETAFGKVSFDENGQNIMSLIATQYNESGAVNVVYPPNIANKEVIYPMPTWSKRDCTKLSECGKEEGPYAGECNFDGTCICADENAFSFGIGPSAACHNIPVEDMTYISPILKMIGYILVGIQGIMSSFSIIWSMYYKDRRIVRLSQPIFLILIAFGCFILTLSIIPLSMEGDYRFEQDPETGLETDIPNKSIKGLDVACMAFPWLLSLGFSITFSALFSKIWRIRKIMMHAKRFRRVQVKARNVAIIMVVIIIIETSILLAWQLVAPLRWERTVVSTSDLLYPTQSVGACISEKNSIPFSATLCCLDVVFLLVALGLCFISRDMDSHFNESKWITASVVSIFQLLILAIPITIIASENTSVGFFVKSIAVFITSMVVSCFIFIPKFYSLHILKVTDEQITQSIHQSMSGSKKFESSFARRGSTNSLKSSINGKKQSFYSQELSQRPSHHNHTNLDNYSIEKGKKSTESNDSFPSEEKNDSVPDVIKRIEPTISVSSEEIYDSCISDIEN